MATIYDLIELSDITPDTTYSLLNGNLIGVVEAASSPALDDGEFDEGDTLQIGGVTYTIDYIQEPLSSGRFILGDGTDQSFDPGSEANLSAIFLTVSNGADVRYFVIPNDSYGDMNVAEVRTGGLNHVAGNDAAIISTSDNSVNVVCFLRGTMILTPSGEIPVERLSVGDLIVTRDHGAQELRAILVRDLALSRAEHSLKPIAFEAGSLGKGRPNARLCLSPQHRLLVTDAQGKEVLVPAKALTARAGVRVMYGKQRVSYYHLVFSRHEIIWSNGALSESFFPGAISLSAIPPETQAELRAIFGTPLPLTASSDTAAPVLAVRDAQRQAMHFR